MDLIIIIFLLGGLFLGWSLGANDAANVFGTAVGTRMIRFKTAAVVCSLFVILGAIISGAGTTETLGKLGAINALPGAFSACVAAGLSVYLMTKLGLPVSTESICKAVINIRTRKLPDPEVIGNIGSFFKNPVISTSEFLKTQKQFSEIVGYKVSETETKVAAGWLIDQCGWKGYRKGDAGVHKNQALVLVNHGNATGEEILSLSKEIQQSVKDKFKIDIHPEVNIIG